MEISSKKWFDHIINEFDIRDKKKNYCTEYINEIQKLQEYQVECQSNKEEITKLNDNINKLYISLGKKQSEIEEQKDINKHLNEELKEKNDIIKYLENMKIQNENEIKKLNQKDIDNKNLCDKKNDAIQVLQDEILALKLELTKTEEKNEALKNENEIWVKQLKDQANKFAQLLNEQNAIVESSKKPNIGGNSNINFKTDDAFGSNITHKIASKIPVNLYSKITTNGQVNCMELSNDAKHICVGIDKKLFIYETEIGRVKVSLSGLVKEVTSVCFNSNNSLVLGTSFDKSIRIWNINGSSKDVLTGHTNKVSAAKFSIDNNIISCSQDRTIKLWNINSGSCDTSIFTHSSCNDLDLMDNSGNLVVTAHLDNSLKIWDMHNKKLIQEITNIHSSPVISVKTSPTGNEILSLSRDNSLKTLDIRMYNTLLTFRDDNLRTFNNSQNACYSSDGKYAICGSGNGSIYIFNTFTNKKEKVLKQSR
ncbi:WD40 repeat-like protein [Piromyces finnis]|uniref:WD40 repeat-like protein n=1 Tax=Piromyces finnis TaxID=1754191 RepID=A0A1Y1VEC1_9FUNG|nr:WD40 repeat-like protein [Piromyces finnis]|eukprot:ORX54205.1 WD40 repeat-like protein [Piromyces finnis]